MAGLLVLLAFFFGYKKRFQMGAVIVALAFIAFLLGQFEGAGIFTFQSNLTVEQILCWTFGAAFFVFAGSLLTLSSFSLFPLSPAFADCLEFKHC